MPTSSLLLITAKSIAVKITVDLTAPTGWADLPSDLRSLILEQLNTPNLIRFAHTQNDTEILAQTCDILINRNELTILEEFIFQLIKDKTLLALADSVWSPTLNSINQLTTISPDLRMLALGSQLLYLQKHNNKCSLDTFKLIFHKLIITGTLNNPSLLKFILALLADNSAEAIPFAMSEPVIIGSLTGRKLIPCLNGEKLPDFLLLNTEDKQQLIEKIILALQAKKDERLHATQYIEDNLSHFTNETRAILAPFILANTIRLGRYIDFKSFTLCVEMLNDFSTTDRNKLFENLLALGPKNHPHYEQRRFSLATLNNLIPALDAKDSELILTKQNMLTPEILSLSEKLFTDFSVAQAQLCRLDFFQPATSTENSKEAELRSAAVGFCEPNLR